MLLLTKIPGLTQKKPLSGEIRLHGLLLPTGTTGDKKGLSREDRKKKKDYPAEYAGSDLALKRATLDMIYIHVV